MNRREFLFFTNPHKNTAELSCQQLYMRYLDSTLDGTTPQFLQEIEQRLSGITSVRLTDSVWLSSDELKPVASLLDAFRARRSEEHTSELQSQSNLVCRLLLEKKKKQTQ